MPYSYSSYSSIGGSPFQQYENQQYQNYLQQQQLQFQKQQQQNPYGGQQNFSPYAQQYGGYQQQYNSLPNYGQMMNNQPFQPTPIQQSDYTTYRGIPKGESKLNFQFQLQPNGIPNNLNPSEQTYLKNQNQNPYTLNYNSLPAYGQFPYFSPSGGTGQFSGF